MSNILGPQGTSKTFKLAVAKLVAQGKTDLQARRIVSTRNQRKGST